MRGNYPTKNAGFTLVELLVTLSLLLVLAGSSIKIFHHISSKVKISKIHTTLKLLEYSLEQYAFDHEGKYPEGRGDLESAQTLFQELAGYTEGGLRDDEKDCYAKYLTLEGSSVGENREVIDPYGNYICYVSMEEKDTENADFRLWSIGQEEVRNLDSTLLNNIQNEF